MKKLTRLCVAALCILNSYTAFADCIKVAVTSQNQIKIEAVREAFQSRFPNDEIDILAIKTSSGIPEQPLGHETALKGAKNRLTNLPEGVISSVNYMVSIENYIEQSSSTGMWKDIGVILLVDNSKKSQEGVSMTKATSFPAKFVQLAKEMSSSSEISEEGFSFTIGQAIAFSYGDRSIDPHDWHRESEFGGVSRQALIKEAIFKAIHADEIAFLKDQIELYPDFPKPGILFEDFFPVLSNGDTFQLCIDLLYEHYEGKNIEAVIGLESRGFILGAALAYKLGVGFVPVRKPGKLPGATYTVSYEKEYGSDSLCISQSALKQEQRVLIIDDLIATGGTAKAAIELVKMAGGIPVEFASVLEVKVLDGRDKLGIPSFNLID